MSIVKEIEKTLQEKKPKNEAKFKKQQAYYKKLVEKGLVKKKKYNLKTLSFI